MKGKSKEKTDVYYNSYNVVNRVIEFIDNPTKRIGACSVHL